MLLTLEVKFNSINQYLSVKGDWAQFYNDNIWKSIQDTQNICGKKYMWQKQHGCLTKHKHTGPDILLKDVR